MYRVKSVPADSLSIIEFLKNTNSSPTHWPNWNLVVSKYFGSRFYYKIILKNDDIIGILPIHREKKGLINYEFSGQYYYIPYGGWLLKENIESKDILFKCSYNTSLIIYQIPYITLINYSNLGNINISFKTLLINLEQDVKQIWENEIDSKRRNMVRKAEKNNIEIQIIYNSFSEIWYELYYESCYKNNLKPLSREFFIDLFKSSGEVNFMIVNAFQNNELLSNAIFAYDKYYSIYWLGSNSKIKNLGQSELIQWVAINKLKELGCKYYDLCYIEKDRLPSIYEFKKGFSKWEVEIPMITKKPFLFRFLKRFFKCF